MDTLSASSAFCNGNGAILCFRFDEYEHAAEQTVEMLVNWDSDTLMSRHCNDANNNKSTIIWAVHIFFIWLIYF